MLHCLSASAVLEQYQCCTALVLLQLSAAAALVMCCSSTAPVLVPGLVLQQLASYRCPDLQRVVERYGSQAERIVQIPSNVAHSVSVASMRELHTPHTVRLAFSLAALRRLVRWEKSESNSESKSDSGSGNGSSMRVNQTMSMRNLGLEFLCFHHDNKYK